ncbi:MAG: AAA family ATPase [Defluviitaleaceae bacterium]|nr:AAA family ATPase [Defluviitaleaceae bacterium]
MKLIVIFGASAVGKMTVGQELAKLTDLRLVHNHMIIEPIFEIFGRRDEDTEKQFTELIFERISNSDLCGMIFTHFWSLNNKTHWAYVEHLVDIFRRKGANIYFVELIASQEIRLQRNGTENRLQHKPTKRNVEASNARLIELDKKIRIETLDGEVPYENYVKINNTDLLPSVVAQMIKDKFSL